MTRIFVQIAAYRDPELVMTINDAIAKAKRPENLSFGICWQGLPEDENDIAGLQFVPNCRIHQVAAFASDGCCWARRRTQELWQGEEYSLQIDSHSRFGEDWDVKLLSMLQVCGSSKPILTTYPASYTYPDIRDKAAKPYRIGANFFNQQGVLELQAVSEIVSLKPVKGYFLSAAIIFGDSSWITEVPYDEKLYFNGEESSLAMRLETNGWDIFHPNEVVIYHNYNRHNAPRHQSEYTNVQRELDSYSRYRQVMAGDSGYCGAGVVRSLAEYQRNCGVDFVNQTIQQNSKVGIFND